MCSTKFLYFFFLTCGFIIVFNLHLRYRLPGFIQINIYSNVTRNLHSVKTIENVRLRSNLSEQNLVLLNLTKIIQERIHRLQFPPNCKTAKILRCISHDTGFGSQMHLRGICLIAAYTSGRTWVPSSNEKFNYSPLLGWDGYFLPVTNCTDKDIVSSGNFTSDVMQIDSFYHKTPSMPPAFPKEFAEILIKYHSYPPLFWIAQFQSFLIRYQPFLEKRVSRKMEELGFVEPIVGVHVRRGDKIKEDESLLYEIDEYMVHVITWFNKSNTKVQGSKSRILLLTDEEDVVEGMISKYPQYEYIFDLSSYNKSNNSTTRYGHENLVDIIAGIHMLSRCTYVVCTFSSNVCRLAYELGQLYRMDDSTQRFLSLDSLYYFWGQMKRYQTAIDNHTENGDIDLLVGDTLAVMDSPQYTHGKPKKRIFDTRFEGENLRTGKIGRYPSSKVREKWATF